ncbi:MAG: chromosome segregation protein SMC [Balneolaceae bacterium]
MYISELQLHGFKSFANKTKVTFDRGVTAIVGPNGCGKSNIVDALRWVLGEQRPSLLRSNSMSNVIFNGTARKKAQGMADVSLTLVNNRGLLPTEYNEVTITRRLYRSGDSEYLINQSTCRLKDIMELFMDTGMGADAYSVIELKMVEEILTDKNNDRRKLFEEAAGVTRYKEKRKQTLRKLDETRTDLLRVEDILVEVRKNTRSLEIQSEKALRAKTFQTELERLDKAWHRLEYQQIEEDLQPLRDRTRDAEREKAQLQSKLTTLEEQDESARQQLTAKEREEAEHRKRVGQLIQSLRDLETTIQIHEEKVRNERGVINRYEEDIRQSRTDLEELKTLREQTLARLQEMEEELERSESSLEQSKQRFNEIQQQYTRERHQLYELEISTAEHKKEQSALHTDRIRLESRLENTEGDRARIESEIKDMEEEISIQKGELGLIQKKRTPLKEEVDTIRRNIEEATNRKEELEGEREALRESIRTLRSQEESLRSEIRLLEDLAASNEYFPTGVTWLLENHASSFSRLDVVSSLLHTDEEHAVALETALGDSIHFVVVGTMEEAIRASRLLKENRKGQATFIPLDELRKSYPVLRHSILTVARYDPPLRALAQLLLGETLLTEDLAQARRLLGDDGTLAVTLDGEWISRHAFLRGGSQGDQAGARLGLRDKLDKLEEKAGVKDAQRTKKEKKLTLLQEELDTIQIGEIRTRLEETERNVRTLEQQTGQTQSTIQMYEKSIGDLKNRLVNLENNETSAREQLEQLSPREVELEQAIRRLETQQEEHKSTLEDLEKERSIAQNRFNDARLSHQDHKNRIANLIKDQDRAKHGIESIQKRIEERTTLTGESERAIRNHKETIRTSSDERTKKQSQKEELDKAFTLAEAATQKQRGEIRELEKEIKTLRHQKEVNLELLHHLEMAQEKLTMRAEGLSDYIWETHGLLMKQLEETLPDEMDRETAKVKISDLKQKLNRIGDVNPLAIEEFEEEKERLAFLEEQVDDLHNAERELRQTIEEINETATSRFNETFQKIRTNFISVFGTLFQEDDYCDLLIEEDVEDPLEAKIEIKANPRGKRPSGINQLSGGEKTLTAIALLFAIYLVKPSPFCVLDEVDAPLDDANIDRFANMIRSFSEQTQFIIITHNKKTMSKAEMMYGVTMPEIGVSKLVGVRLDDVPTDPS